METCTMYMIGISLSLSAKTAVMREVSPFCGGSTSDSPNNCPKRSIQMREKMTSKSLSGCREDDETCSTTSTSETDEDDDDNDEEDNSVLSVYGDCRSVEQPSVTFASPLITDIHFRPRTLRQDKAILYYSDADYRSFRREFHREHSVRFLPQVVTDVWKYDFEPDNSLYYSEQEIQEFLDEFVASLLVAVPPT